MKVFGNLGIQESIRNYLRTNHKFGLISLSGVSHLGKFSFIESEINDYAHSTDIFFCSPTIDSIREAISFSETEPNLSASKYIILDSPEKMIFASQDALLKVCESTFANVIFISSDVKKLQPPLQSRIRHDFRFIPISDPEMDEFISGLSSNDEIRRISKNIPGIYKTFISNSSYYDIFLSIDKYFYSRALAKCPVPKLDDGCQDIIQFMVFDILSRSSDLSVRSQLSTLCAKLDNPSLNLEFIFNEAKLALV